MVGCELDSKVHNAAVLVFLYDYSSSILAAPFIVARLRRVPGVPARAALPAVLPPLPRVAAAVDLVVVVVGRRVEAVSPSGRSGWRFDQSAMTLYAHCRPQEHCRDAHARPHVAHDRPVGLSSPRDSDNLIFADFQWGGGELPSRTSWVRKQDCLSDHTCGCPLFPLNPIISWTFCRGFLPEQSNVYVFVFFSHDQSLLCIGSLDSEDRLSRTSTAQPA